MKNENKNLYYLHELTDYKVADNYSDVRDWEVVDSDGRYIGKVDALLVNKEAERVVYLDVEVDSSVIEAGHETYSQASNEGVHEFLNSDGENHLIIPIGVVKLDKNLSKVHCDTINYSMFARTKRFKKGADIDRSYEKELLVHNDHTITFDEVTDSSKSFYDRPQFTPKFDRE
jgi:sporulation protein YlmC with PRC-barrel domain